MKILKKSAPVLSLLILLLFNVLLAKAVDPIETNILYDSYDLDTYFEMDDTLKNIDDQMFPEQEVQILDVNDKLVTKGSENNTDIKSLVSISDLLIEIDGTKYYRISFQ